MARLWLDAPSDSRDAKLIFVKIILGSTRRYRRLRRKILGARPPEWLNDLSGLLGPAKLIDLIPTYYSILFIPKHFFRRLQANGKRTGSVGLSPVNFLLQSAAICVGCFAAVAALIATLGPDFPFSSMPRVDRTLILEVLCLLALLSPIWLAMLAWVIAKVGNFFDDGAPRTNLNHPLGVIHLFFPYDAARACAQRLRFGRFARARYFWGSCYMSVATATVGLIFLIVSTIVLLVGYGAKDLYLEPEMHLRIYEFTVLIAASWLLKRFLCAYASILDSVCAYPKRAFHRKHVRIILRDKRRLVNRIRSRRRGERVTRLLRASVDDCIRDNKRIEARLSRDRRMLEVFRTERASEFASLVNGMAGSSAPVDVAGFSELLAFAEDQAGTSQS